MSQFAKHLRRNATEAERAVWSMLRAGRLDGLKFKRQTQLGPYIADFVCFDQKLIVEIDGSQHAESERDERRDAYFAQAGYRTLRFWNNDALSNREGLAKAILAAAGRQI
jgi:very-short-patch-repair endonuclease